MGVERFGSLRSIRAGRDCGASCCPGRFGREGLRALRTCSEQGGYAIERRLPGWVERVSSVFERSSVCAGARHFGRSEWTAACMPRGTRFLASAAPCIVNRSCFVGSAAACPSVAARHPAMCAGAFDASCPTLNVLEGTARRFRGRSRYASLESTPIAVRSDVADRLIDMSIRSGVRLPGTDRGRGELE